MKHGTLLDFSTPSANKCSKLNNDENEVNHGQGSDSGESGRVKLGLSASEGLDTEVQTLKKTLLERNCLLNFSNTKKQFLIVAKL